MSTETKLFLSVIGGTFLLIFGAAFLLGKNTKIVNNPASQITKPELLIKDTSWGMGSPSATLTLVEFSDFQCPSCKAADPVVKSVLAKYVEKIKFYYRHFPLSQHEFAMNAAIAAEAAGKQGVDKFWQYHDKLFDMSPDLSKENLLAIATELNLDLAKFTADMESDTTRQKVLDDQADGTALGVNSTPTFFINGTKLVGFGDLEKEIFSRIK